MTFDMTNLDSLDIEGMSPRELAQLRERLFGPPAELQFANALNRALHDKAERDLWAIYEGRADPPSAPGAKPYRTGHQRLISMANVLRTIRRGSLARGRVTDFTKWVHSLYWYRTGTPDALAKGKLVEKGVARLATPPTRSEWDLIYCDLLDERPEALGISALAIGGQPIWGAPDLVFRHATTGEVVIVERKASDKPIPIDGWPDLRAQLWCYSKIDRWRDAPVIRLIGEVWWPDENRLRRRRGGVLRWQRDDATFERNNAELWALYKAECEKM